MAAITDKTRIEVKNIVYDFFAEECEVDISEIHDNTSIIQDLDGDSLMFLELIEIFKKKYDLNIELKTIGKYSVKNPVETIGELIDMQMLIIEHENDIININ
ncbi:MAG: acyl carrier protein [Bacteroidota bacterium]